MNIQIYSAKKNFDVQKAERFFRERRIPVQMMDLKKHPLGEREIRLMLQQVGMEKLLLRPGGDADSRDSGGALAAADAGGPQRKPGHGGLSAGDLGGMAPRGKVTGSPPPGGTRRPRPAHAVISLTNTQAGDKLNCTAFDKQESPGRKRTTGGAGDSADEG